MHKGQFLRSVARLSMTILLMLVSMAPAQANTRADGCDADGAQVSGAKYRICVPNQWNGTLIVYAHGYVNPSEPIQIPENQISSGNASIISATLNAGYAFATTSYSVNGLAVREGMADILDLVNIFTRTKSIPTNIILFGVSEGGLITTLLIEQHPEVFSGGLAACGPVGDFAVQTNYFGDFRVVFDYFYPNVMPGSAITIPQTLIDNWQTFASTTIVDTIKNDPLATIHISQLLNATDAPYDATNPISSATQTIAGLLSYNVYATNDAKAKLGGNPFDNIARKYSGTFNDSDLNKKVARYSADVPALSAINSNYQTSGNLRVPLVTLHTTLDEIVPFKHEALYATKVANQNKQALLKQFSVARYGHCAFQPDEVMTALTTLNQMVVTQKYAHHVALPLIQK
jgi:pimeloyl-ACP methyl ester carboxylesterase